MFLPCLSELRVKIKIYLSNLLFPFLILTSFISFGCATFKDIKLFGDEATTVIFDMGYEEVWDAVKNVAEQSYHIYILDKDSGIIQTTKTLEFSKERLYRQYVVLYVEVRGISINFTSVTVNFELTRYNPGTFEWNAVSGVGKQENFIKKVKKVLESRKAEKIGS